MEFKIKTMKINAANSINLNNDDAILYAIIENMDDIHKNWRDNLPIIRKKAQNIIYR